MAKAKIQSILLVSFFWVKKSEYGMLGIDVSSHVCDHRMNSEENTLVFKIKYDKRPNGFSPASTWEKKEDLLKLAPAIYANYLDMHLEYAILD